MEFHYNLTSQDLKRGLVLHERRPKGVLAVIRKVERLFFFLMALASGCLMAMLLFLLVRRVWEEDFSAALAVSGSTLAVCLLFLALTSPLRRAARGFRMLGQVPDYLGPRTLALEPEGVAISYGPNRRVEPYAALQEIWERRGFVLLYLKSGLWEVVPPCAFQDEVSRRSFLAALEAARAGRPPENVTSPQEPEVQTGGAPACPMPGKQKSSGRPCFGPIWPTPAAVFTGGPRWFWGRFSPCLPRGRESGPWRRPSLLGTPRKL